MNTRTIVLAASLFPATLSAQSLFHAPMPQQPQRPESEENSGHNQQPAPAPANAAPAAAQPATPAPAPAQPGQPAQHPDTPNAAAVTPPQIAPRPMLPTGDQISLFAVKPLKPKMFNKQDKVQIVINESSLQKFDQKTDAKESADVNAALTALPSIQTLLADLALRNTGTPTPKIGAANGSNYKGEGTYERKDKFTARISAIVTDVKPNGMLVLEAREMILSDKESQSLVVSGLCDPKDITNDNTVTSSQLANLVIRTEHAGDVKDAATKGWFPRIMDKLSGNN
jgi:flagellar L-ring protein precursor FlgH